MYEILLNMETALTQMATIVANAVSSLEEETQSSGSKGRTAFQWGGTISAMICITFRRAQDVYKPFKFYKDIAARILLIVNRTGRRSSIQTSLLVLYLLTSFPTVLFKILRGQFGCWVAFLAVAANLFFPETFPVSRFLLFVITPDWLADGLRDSIFGGVFCLIIGVLLFIMEILGGCTNCERNSQCFCYCFSILLLFFFTILYLWLGPW